MHTHTHTNASTYTVFKMLPVYVPDTLGLIVMLIVRSYVKQYSREYYTTVKSSVFSVWIGAVDHPTSVLESVLFSMAIIVLSGPDHSPMPHNLEIVQPKKNDLHGCFIYLWLSPCCLLSPPLRCKLYTDFLSSYR